MQDLNLANLAKNRMILVNTCLVLMDDHLRLRKCFRQAKFDIVGDMVQAKPSVAAE